MFKSLFNPKLIAIIGASTTPGKLGYNVFENLKILGYRGKVFPVNPKGGEILGTKVFMDLNEIKTRVDLAVIIVPAPFVVSELEKCGEKGIKNIIIISAGFKEIGGEGSIREQKIKKLIQKYKLNLIGPNCLGIINTHTKMNASFAEGMPDQGNVALVSQSGAMAVAISDWAYTHDLGFSKIISLGNKAGVNETDLLEYLGKDQTTKVILMYLESIENGQEFMQVAKKISKEKPIVILKSGTSAAGTKAISSHTGSLAGSNEAIKAAFKQCGIVHAESMQDLFDFGRAFSYQRSPQGNQVALITNAGGPGIMATDAISNTKLRLSQFSTQTTENLKTELPVTANLHNPVDIIGDALAERYESALKNILQDQNVDAVIILLTPQSMTEEEKTADLIIQYSQKYPQKTILTCFMGGKNIQNAVHNLSRNKIPNFTYPNRAVRTLEKMWKQVSIGKVVGGKLQVVEDKVVSKNGQGEFLPMSEVFSLLKQYQIAVPDYQIAASEEEATQKADLMGYPVVLKICSKEIVHKSDSGGVMINLQNSNEVRSAFKQILANAQKHYPQSQVGGVLVQKMLNVGHEVILGMKRDSSFGPLIMFGLGGVYVEILKDVTFRIAPLECRDALEMIQEIKAIKLLQGARGSRPVDLVKIAEVICQISKLSLEHPEIQELDINPLIIGEDNQAVALDARVLVD